MTYCGNDVFFGVGTYANNGRLYVGLMENYYDEAYEMEVTDFFTDVTINVSSEPLTDESCGFVDVVANPDIEAFLKDNGIAEPTGSFGVHGFACYPEYRFNMENVKAGAICLDENRYQDFIDNPPVQEGTPNPVFEGFPEDEEDLLPF